MKAKKVIRTLLVILAALVLLVVCDVLFWLGPTVKLAAQRIGSKALGTPLTINELSINPHKGTIHLSGFSINNPESYGRSNVVSLASMDIAIDMNSIFSQTVVVHNVAINSPHFIYEMSTASDNISEFILNIQDFTGIDPQAPKKDKPAEAQAPEKKDKPKIVVERLAINDVQFHIANTDEPELDFNIGLEQLTLGMTNGTVSLKNLHIGNPGTLSTPNLFTLDGIDIQLAPESIYSGTVSIQDIQVRNPHAYLELNHDSDTVSAFMKIAENVAARVPTNSTGVATQTVAAVEMPDSIDAPASPPFELHNLLVDDIQVKLLDTTRTNAPAGPGMLAGIGSIAVKLVDGKIQVKGITVPSPSGYTVNNLFHLANIDVSIAPESIFSDQVVINEVFVNSPEFNLEQTKTTGNVTELQATLMRFVPPKADAAADQTTPASEPDPAVAALPLAEQPVVLHALVVTNLAVNLTLPVETNTLVEVGTAEAAGTNGQAVAKKVIDGPLTLVGMTLLKVEPLKGLLTINGLRIANPPGFANKYLVELPTFTLDLDPDSIQSDTLFIRDILMEKPRIAYERKIMTDNIKAFQKEIEKAVGRKKDDTAGADQPEDVAEPDDMVEERGQKVIIEHLLARGGLVRAKLSALPTIPIPLPNIEINDLGKSEEDEKQGADLTDALTEIGDTFYETIIGSVSSATGFAGDALKGVGGMGFDMLGNIRGGPTNALPTRVEPPPVETEDEAPKRRRRTLGGKPRLIN